MSFILIKDLQYYVKLPYKVVTEESEYTDGSKSFHAFHPELPGCSSHGETPEEAIEDLNDARRCYVEALLEAAEKIPLPELPSTLPWTGNRGTPSTKRYRMVPQAWLGQNPSQGNKPSEILQEI